MAKGITKVAVGGDDSIFGTDAGLASTHGSGQMAEPVPELADVELALRESNIDPRLFEGPGPLADASVARDAVAGYDPFAPPVQKDADRVPFSPSEAPSGDGSLSFDLGDGSQPWKALGFVQNPGAKADAQIDSRQGQAQDETTKTTVDHEDGSTTTTIEVDHGGGAVQVGASPTVPRTVTLLRLGQAPPTVSLGRAP